MNGKLTCICLLVLQLGLSLFSPDSVGAAETIRLTNGEWPPLMSQGIKHDGVISRIVREAFAMENVTVEYGFFPWKTAYELAKGGEWDGSVVWIRTDERAKHFLYSDPVYNDRGAFFYLKGSDFDWKNSEDLARYTFGVALGYSYGADFDRLMAEKQVKVVQSVSDELNFNKLLMGQVDACLSNIEIGYYLLRTKFGPGVADLVTHHPRFYLKEEPLHVIISRRVPKAEEYIRVFNRGLYRLKESGMYDKYFLESRRGDYLR